MRKHSSMTDLYDSCVSEGYIRQTDLVNKDAVKNIVLNAESSIKAAEIISKNITKNEREWQNVFLLYYDSLRMYCECITMWDKIGINNHQCLFTYVCVKHGDLELDWEFLELVRSRRNGINYYGETIQYANWKEIELKVKLYLSGLKKHVEQLLKK